MGGVGSGIRNSFDTEKRKQINSDKSKKWRENNPEKYREYNKNWKINNPAKVRLINNESYKNRKHIYFADAKNRRKIRTRQKKWWKKVSALNEYIIIYKIIIKDAAVRLYKKHNPTREEMWDRYRQLANDFQEMQRMRKAA